MYECAEEFRWLYTRSGRGWTRTERRAEPRAGFGRARPSYIQPARMEKRENDERSAEAFRIPARSELGVGEPMVVRLCYSGGAAFSLHLLCSVIPRHTGPIVSVTVYYYYYY